MTMKYLVEMVCKYIERYLIGTSFAFVKIISSIYYRLNNKGGFVYVQ